MQVTAWKPRGSAFAASTYGISVGRDNRRYFRPEWESVVCELPSGQSFEIKITPGFWHKCPELRHPGFRAWFAKQGQLTWRPYHPPQYELVPVGDRRFALRESAAASGH